MSVRRAAGIALAAACFCAPAFAAPVKYGIDSQHTSVALTMQHEQWSKYQATISDLTGIIVFDKDDVAASTVVAKTYPRSINTMDTGRQGELRGPGFLNESANPDITFVSTHVEKTGSNTGKITGNLSMAGVVAPITLDATFNGEGPSSWDGKQRIGFSATGTLDANTFNLTGFKALNIGPVIDFTIELEAVRRD